MKPFVIFIMMVSYFSADCFAQSKRSKSINFEDELIEGINRKPLDSFNQLSEQNKNKKSHLYNKRSGFNDRQQVLFTEMELTQ